MRGQSPTRHTSLRLRRFNATATDKLGESAKANLVKIFNQANNAPAPQRGLSTPPFRRPDEGQDLHAGDRAPSSFESVPKDPELIARQPVQDHRSDLMTVTRIEASRTAKTAPAPKRGLYTISFRRPDESKDLHDGDRATSNFESVPKDPESIARQP